MNALTHEQARERFRPWVDEELDVEGCDELRVHLQSCDDCREDWEAYSGAVSELRALPTPEVPRDLAARILRRARRRRPALRALQLATAYRVPTELVLPLLVAATLLWWFLT